MTVWELRELLYGLADHLEIVVATRPPEEVDGMWWKATTIQADYRLGWFDTAHGEFQELATAPRVDTVCLLVDAPLPRQRRRKAANL